MAATTAQAVDLRRAELHELLAHAVQRVKHHLSRQADLVRLVQSLGSAPQFRG